MISPSLSVVTHVLPDGVHGERIVRVLVRDVPNPARDGGAEKQHLALPNLSSKE